MEYNSVPGIQGKLKIDSDKLQWQKEGAFYSKEYGVLSQTEKLSSSVRTALPAEVTLSISMPVRQRIPQRNPNDEDFNGRA